MSDEISPELFNHLVELELDAAEADYLRRQLNNQLKAIHELETIPIDPETPVASHGVPYTQASSPSIRADELHPYPISYKLRVFQEFQGHFYMILAPFSAKLAQRRAAEAAAQYMKVLRTGRFSPGGASTY